MSLVLTRRREVSRIEGFSDAVFGFALTLLVVSLEVPSTFTDLMTTMRGFVAFACCFASVSWIWYEHNVFFRRHGLQDPLTVTINCALLFVVLFYVYPLKFLFTRVINQFTGFGPGFTRDVILPTDITTLMVIYGLGFMIVFVLLALLYDRAYRKRRELDLTDLEVFEVRADRLAHFLSAAVAVLSILIAVFGGPRWAAISGMSYALLGPIHGLYWWRVAVQRERMANVEPASPD